MMKYDVIVAGAGSAGFGAAIGAARLGKKVLLFDSNSTPGGTTVFGGCPVLTGNSSFTKLERKGVFREFIDALGDKCSFPRDTTCNTGEADIALHMLRMLKAAGVEMLFYATLTDVKISGDKIENITLFSCGQKLLFEADQFVDTTGDAILADLAGCPTVTAEEEDSMTKTLLFRVTNVGEVDKVEIQRLFPQLAFPYPWQDKFMGTAVSRDGKDFLVNLSAVPGNAMDPFDRTRMDIELREQVEVIFHWLREKVPGFENCRISAVAPSIGIRCGRNIVGKEQITCTDLDENTPVENGVAYGKRFYGDHYIKTFSSPWSSKTLGGLRMVPYGCLLPQKITNLTVGGRCISVEPRCITSIRLASCCMATGQVAGIAAAMGIPEYAVLKKELEKQNLL